MITFKPNSISESIGLGVGLAAASGHSLHLGGTVRDANSGIQNKPFCSGYVRIEKRKSDQDSTLGLFQIRNDEGNLSFTAALFFGDDDFSSVREILLRCDDDILLQIENADWASLEEIARAKPSSISISATSISGTYKTAYFNNKGK